MKLNIVDNSIPFWGSAVNIPMFGGPLVVTTTDVEESPHDNAKINEELNGRALFAITKFTNWLLFAKLFEFKEDIAPLLRINEVLLVTDQTEVQKVKVIIRPVRIYFDCGLMYVYDWSVEVIDTIGASVDELVGFDDEVVVVDVDDDDDDKVVLLVGIEEGWLDWADEGKKDGEFVGLNDDALFGP